MTKDELIAELKRIADKAAAPHPVGWDEGNAHIEADAAILTYLADEEIQEAYDAIDKWYE